VLWPGDAEGVRRWLGRCHERWRSELEGLAEPELESPARTRWPITGRPFADVAAWVNLDLMKNAAEIGYARFLFASRPE
jgi:hypothetical protein